jgi:hypothetical protein
MFFSQDHREKVRTENASASFGEYIERTVRRDGASMLNPDDATLSPGEIGRLLGAKWKEFSESEKKPYQDMADRDKIRAEDEKKAYKASGGGATASTRRCQRRRRRASRCLSFKQQHSLPHKLPLSDHLSGRLLPIKANIFQIPTSTPFLLLF